MLLAGCAPIRHRRVFPPAVDWSVVTESSPAGPADARAERRTRLLAAAHISLRGLSDVLAPLGARFADAGHERRVDGGVQAEAEAEHDDAEGDVGAAGEGGRPVRDDHGDDEGRQDEEGKIVTATRAERSSLLGPAWDVGTWGVLMVSSYRRVPMVGRDISVAGQEI